MIFSRIAVMVCVALLSAPAAAQTIYMEATGTVSAAPDLATVSVGVTAKAPTPEATMAASAATVNALLATLAQAGIAPRDIQTTRFDFGTEMARPNYQTTSDYLAEEKLIGYRVSNTVQVRIRDIDAVGALIGRIIAVGATSIDGLSFSIEDPTPLYDQARAKAFERAQIKAEIYARAAHRKLGELKSIREGVGYDPERMVQIAYADGAADLGVLVEPGTAAGELELSVSITAVWDAAPL